MAWDYAKAKGRGNPSWKATRPSTAGRQAAGWTMFDKDFERELHKFFKDIPETYQRKAISNIYRKALRPMQAAIKANINTSTGRLAKMIKIKSLRVARGQEPASMVYLSVARKKDKKSKTGKTLFGSAAYGYALEYGTADRQFKQPHKVYSFGAGWVTVKSAGRLPGQFFFRRGVDSTKAGVKAEVEMALKKYGQKELDRQIANWNRKATKILVNM